MKAIEALRELANARDDLGLPSGGIDSMRREVTALMVRTAAANDNNQPGRHE